MKVCYFGSYSHVDPRNLVLMEGLRQNGIEVIECHDDSPNLKKFWRLFRKHWKIRKQYDVIIVGFLGQMIAPFAAFLNLSFISFRPRKLLIFDAFLSIYDSNVFGRQIVKPGTPKAFYYWLLDWVSMRFGDVVLFDTKQHIDYIAAEFGVPKKRLARIFGGGAIESIFHPLPYLSTNEKFRVLFYGTFIRSQGIEYILEAAKLLEADSEIEIRLVGAGQVKDEMLALAEKLQIRNVKWVGFVPHTQVAQEIAQADVCLGLFGKPAKIQRVIPTKVFECAAMARPIITGEAPAIYELFSDEDIKLVKMADPEDLARAILELKKDPVLRQKLGENAYKKFKEFASTKKLGEQLKNIILDQRAI